MPQFSVLDTKPSHILEFPLTVTQQIWLIFLLPTLGVLLLYIIEIATGIGVGVALVSEGHTMAGVATLAFLYLPALVSYALRLSCIPETRQISVALVWLILETAAFIFFPIRILQCLGERVFWSIEALRLRDPDREEALIEFEATRVHVIENYLFLQAFLEAAPQAVLQTLLLLRLTSTNTQTQLVEAGCVLSSLMTVAMVTSSYQRYETQVRGGRPAVWSDSGLLLPAPRRWVKVMEEDDPVGRLVCLAYWFLFLLARLLSLGLAAFYKPEAVALVIGLHYLLNLVYILPSPTPTTSLPSKFLLAALYLFCLIEVSVPLRKSSLFFTLFFTLTILENIGLTLLWALSMNWSGHHYYYIFYFLGVTHVLCLLLLFLYFKYFQPHTKRLELI